MPEQAPALVLPDTLDLLVKSFERSLRAANSAERTRITYLAVARRFAAFLLMQGMPTEPTAIARDHVEEYLNYYASLPTPRTKAPPAPMTVILWYNSLRAFFNWLVEVDEIKHSPMERMKPPRGAGKKRPVLSVEQVRAILKTCEGKRFEDRRDHAMIMLFIDTGLRVAEMAALRVEDVIWERQEITVRHGKGDKARTVYFGRRTAKALDQYMYLKGGRREHPKSALPYLWLSQRGPFTKGGIQAMLQVRGKRAGIPKMHSHLWRHFFIHSSLQAGMQLGDLQRITGHSNLKSLLGYADSAADERARESHRKLGPGDRL